MKKIKQARNQSIQLLGFTINFWNIQGKYISVDYKTTRWVFKGLTLISKSNNIDLL